MSLRLLRSLTRSGPQDISRRLARRAYLATGAANLEVPLLPDQVTDSATVRWPHPLRRPDPGTPLVFGWVSAAPGPGSGGHTTMFRMIRALESRGHTCILHLFDRYGSPVSYHRDIVRQYWPDVAAAVVDADSLRYADAYVATSWQSAHILGQQTTTVGRRFYFVQDYEPFFYARGSEYALAEDTYRFGFENIALGHMVCNALLAEASVRSHLVEFGCDTETYRMYNTGHRRGVVFYSRPDTPRRGALLAAAGLTRFHSRHPDQPIHVVGPIPDTLTMDVIHHSLLAPHELAALYNSALCGIGMSFTNISLVVEEMLACGAIPIVNDSAYARADMPHSEVEWCNPTPAGIADALCRVVEGDRESHRAPNAAAEGRTRDWSRSARQFVEVVERHVYGSHEQSVGHREAKEHL